MIIRSETDCVFTLSRYTYTITVRIDENEFSVVPMELRGHHIQLVPVVFSIGINEQATLADK